MCGIAGLFLKDAALESRLGRLVSDMLITLSDRGPDSAGFAVYGASRPDSVKLTLRGRVATESGVAACGGVTPDLATEIDAVIGTPAEITRRATHLVLTIPEPVEPLVRSWLAQAHPELRIVGTGTRMELYKEVGPPAAVADRFDLAGMSGTHAVGHTRMATESAVTTDGAHPFSTGRDQCLVHNGSLSNHNAIRRALRHEGFVFDTENDSEVAAGYLTWRMRQGATLKQALESGLADLDGFYTFVVGTDTGFAVLRDPISCKPAIMAETASYVAFGSEYRALARLPGIETAHVFEPEPATVYTWERG